MAAQRRTMPRGVYLDEMFGPQVAQRLTARSAGLRVERAAAVLPEARDSAQLAYAATQQLVLTTANVQDFIRLHEQWTVGRDWGTLSRPHAGVLVLAGDVLHLDWADIVADLLLHPRSPPLEDQLLLWEASQRRWVVDYPYASQRRRPLAL